MRYLTIMKDDKKAAESASAPKVEKEAEKPRYNKTWEAVIKFRGSVKVNDPTLFKD